MSDVARLRAYPCNDCARHGRTPERLALPGICPPCARDARGEEATMRLANAVKSIHPERRWARSLSDPLMSERLSDIKWWRILLAGDATCNGETAKDIQWAPLVDSHRLIISGPNTTIRGEVISSTGIGKTSIAVAMMRMLLDEAHAAFAQKNEIPLHYASQARFVAAIDLMDPEMLKMATGASLLVLDDAGQEGKCGGFEGERKRAIVGDLLDRRERSKKHRTIVTTFGGHQDWIDWYGGRVARLYWEDPPTAVLEVRRAA